MKELLKKSGTWLRDGWLMLGVTLGMFVFVELTVRLFGGGKEPAPRPFVHPVLNQFEWGRQYRKDLGKWNWGLRYEPHVSFRQKAHKSKTINVDEKGFRAISKNGPPDASLKIFTFGGSTMIGASAPDWGSIPAYLAAKLNAKRPRVRITDYGTCWWASSQSVSQLVLSLRRGERPDVVVFYDGINDVDVVTYGGVPGGISPYAVTLLTRALADQKPPPSEGIIRSLVRVSRFLAMVDRSDFVNYVIRRKARRKVDANSAAVLTRKDPPFAVPPNRMAPAAAEIASQYENNVRIVSALAERFKFKAYFILQPFPLISKKKLSANEEKVFQTRANRETEAKLVNMVYERIRASRYLKSHAGFRDWSRTFDDYQGEVYGDVEHLLPDGNKKIAEMMIRLMDETGAIR